MTFIFGLFIGLMLLMAHTNAEQEKNVDRLLEILKKHEIEVKTNWSKYEEVIKL